MQTVWPTLTYYLSVLATLGIGALSLLTGDSPLLVTVKAGLALLVFSTLGWMLNMALLTAQRSPSAQQNTKNPKSKPSSRPDSVETAVEPDADTSPQGG